KGNVMLLPLISARMLTPSAEPGTVKFSACPKITGWDVRTMSLTMGRKTSASSRNVAVSDQFRADTFTSRPPCKKSSASILVNGHGPAMHDVRALRNSFPSPASSDAEPTDAFHFPSGEQGGCLRQGTLPVFATSKALTALPTLAVLVVLMEYRARTFDTTIGGRFAGLPSCGRGTMRAT